MSLPTDPLLTAQWHLRGSAAGGLDLNVAGAWDPAEGPARTGAGTRTVVIDSGVDFRHADLAAGYDRTRDFDFETGAPNAFGPPSEAHGTAVAGLIGAAADGAGAVGVAFGTSLVGYRTRDMVTDAWLRDVRDAIADAAARAEGDIANISQSVANDALSEFGAGYAPARFDQIEDAIGQAVALGRSGLGATIVKAAGNGRDDDFDVNADDWCNDTRQVVVAAVDRDGSVSSYSSYGAAVLVSGFGTAGEVCTTDRTGARGYTRTDYSMDFNGTSAAAPMVSGVVALMYEADAALGWRDVQSILGVSARHVGAEVGAEAAGAERFAWEWNGAATWNGGGQHFSNDYGYGLVDGLAAVRLAETWLLTGTRAATSADEAVNRMDLLDADLAIPDGDRRGLTFTAAAEADGVVERVAVKLTLSTTYTADLEVYLISPSGTRSVLVADAGRSNDLQGSWTFESQAFRGERAAGDWSVRVVDDGRGDAMRVSDCVIRTFGTATGDDRYVFTNELAAYAGLDGHATAIADASGGVDTVNAAAVTGASTIRLDGREGAIAGVGMRFEAVEHAIGGDGDDRLVGSDAANGLWGMRGADTLLGGRGVDALWGGSGADALVGSFGSDRLRGGAEADVLLGQAGRDVLSGDGGADVLIGGLGDDRFVFGAAAHSAWAAFDRIRKDGAAPAFEGAGADGGDGIDLSGLDADPSVAGDQAFRFGVAAPGGLSLVDDGAATIVCADLTPSAGAEFRIAILDGGGVAASDYWAGDFVL